MADRLRDVPSINLLKSRLFQLGFCLICFLPSYGREKVTIIGAGPAGLTAGIYAGQASLSPLVVEGGECDGELAKIYNIENYPGFPEGIQGPELINRLHKQAEHFGARFVPKHMIDINLSSYPYQITLTGGEVIETDTVILATGAVPRKLDLPSALALEGKGVSYSATCDSETFAGKDVVVVGGGDAALQEALLLTHCAKTVTIVHRAEKFNAADYLQQRVVQNEKITSLMNATVEEIGNVEEGRVTHVVISQNSKNRILPCEGVFVSIGRVPNTALFKNKLNMTPQGLIIVEGRSSQTSSPGVFAAGELIDPTYRKAITAAASGCTAAIDATRYLN